jgi:glutaredoxin-like protein NrdH
LRRKKKVKFYGLSTCVWCKRTKRLLKEMGVIYEGVDVDLLSKDEERKVRDYINGLDTDGSFPVVVIDNKEIITGYDEDRIRAALS